MGPVGRWLPGIHFGYTRVTEPDATGMVTLECRMLRGASVASTRRRSLIVSCATAKEGSRQTTTKATAQTITAEQRWIFMDQASPLGNRKAAMLPFCGEMKQKLAPQGSCNQRRGRNLPCAFPELFS